MSGLLIDSGLDGLHGTVEMCDDCETSTVHLAVPDGVAVCALCGYNPVFDDFADDYSDDELPTNIIQLADYR
jgi:hypothetical protein